MSVVNTTNGTRRTPSIGCPAGGTAWHHQRLRGLRRGSLVIFALLALFLVGGCQPITEEKATLPWLAETEREGDVTAELSETEAVLVAAGAELLADELAVDSGAVTFVGIESVDWPDASLGCPEPDMNYAMMLTPGYRIAYSVNGSTVEVHSGASPEDPVLYCP